jgi:hypothetical protein
MGLKHYSTPPAVPSPDEGNARRRGVCVGWIKHDYPLFKQTAWRLQRLPRYRLFGARSTCPSCSFNLARKDSASLRSSGRCAV